MKTCFCHLTVVWRPLAKERIAISTQSIHRWKVHLVGYNSVADNTGLFSFVYSCYCLRNTRNVAKFQENLTLQQFKVIHGHRSWCQWKTYMWLPINCNCSRICYRFRDIHAYKDIKLLILPIPPLFDAPARGNPLEFPDETYSTKTRGMWLPTPP